MILYPYLFRTIRFDGFVPYDEEFSDVTSSPFSESSPAYYLGFLKFIRNRVSNYLRNPELLSFIETVEIWNWTWIPWNLHNFSKTVAVPTSRTQTFPMSTRMFIQYWILTYRTIKEFLSQLPYLRTIRFHECDKGTHPYNTSSVYSSLSFFPSSEIFATPRSCVWLEYTLPSRAALEGLQIPEVIRSRTPGRGRQEIRQLYIQQLLHACPLVLVEAKVNGNPNSIVPNPTSLLPQPMTLEALSLSSDIQPLTSLQLTEILSSCPNLLSLDIFCPLPETCTLPLDVVPSLQAISGPTQIISQVVPGRPIHTVRLREPFAVNLCRDYLFLTQSTSETGIKTFDVMEKAFSLRDFVNVGKALEGVKLRNLLLSWSEVWMSDVTLQRTDVSFHALNLLSRWLTTSSLSQAIMRHIFLIASPFPHLTFLALHNSPPSLSFTADALSLTTADLSLITLLQQQNHPTLETVHIGELVRLAWKKVEIEALSARGQLMAAM
ncbi:MAG TPA: hypothetical protein VGO47_08255, partial [Chlamydiales bacterium]|nr:hypothetical protein [Chlamydiales bacterium]